jgi:hypothetical protein
VLLGAPQRCDTGTSYIANDRTSGPTRFTAKKGEYVQIRGCEITKA